MSEPNMPQSDKRPYSDDEEDNTWEDWEDDERGPVKSLFADATFPAVEDALAYDAAHHGFDLRQYRKQMHANEYDTLKIINYIRSEVAAHRKPLLILQPATATAAEMRDSSSYPWLDDRYLSPALQDDEFLFHDWENDDIHGEPKRPCYSEGNDEERELVELQAATTNTSETLPEALLAEDADLAAAFADMQALALTDPALRGLLLSAAEAPTTTPTQQQQQQQQQWEMGSKSTPSSVDKEHPVSSSDTFDHTLISQSDAGHHQQPQPKQQPPQEEEQKEVNDAAYSARAAADSARAAAIDDAYFESYSFFDIHREMLGDRARTEAYQKALENNPSLIQNATLLDIGCGTGVLSMFAARGGASKVFAVDGSPVIAEYARKICAANRFGGGEEGPVVVLSEKAENLAALPGLPEGGKVDILVSEWMGYALLFESMLDSVIIARDRFLRPGGAILPDLARIYVAAAGQGATGLSFWQNVYGLDMSVIGDTLRRSALTEALVRPVHPQDLCTEGVLVKSLDVATMTAEDQDFTAEFTLRPGAGPRECHALVLWFDTLFTDRFCKEAPQELPTGPEAPPTHWAQTVLVLPRTVTLAPAVANAQGAAVALQGRISMARRAGRHRTLDISVEYAPLWADGTKGDTVVQMYAMGVSTDS